MARRGLIAMLAATLAGAGGCGADESGFAPAAEPATSPPLSTRPAGTTFEIGAEPEGLIVDGPTATIAAITRDPSALTIADLRRRRVLRRVALPATGRHLALRAPGGPALVPVEQSDELVEVSLPGGRRRAIAVGDHPHDAVAAAGRVFVGDEFADTVSVIEGGRVVDELDAPEQPGGLAASAGRLAVVAVAERVLAVYDARTLEPLASLDAGVGPTHVVAGGGRAWVADAEGDALLGYRLEGEPQLISTTELPGSPYGIAIDERRGRIWVTLTDRNELVGFDVSGDRPQRLATYATVGQPNSVAVDARSGAGRRRARRRPDRADRSTGTAMSGQRRQPSMIRARSAIGVG